MPNGSTLHFRLDARCEALIAAQLATGRFEDANEVIWQALLMFTDRRQRNAAFEAMIEEGLDDIRAGRVRDADDVFDELEAELHALHKKAAE